jgi:hypothetical protein
MVRGKAKLGPARLRAAAIAVFGAASLKLAGSLWID